MNKEHISVLELIQSRRSIRRYAPDPVPQEWVEKMLSAAIWAPSAHNRQPWRFVVIEKSGTKEHLATSMGDRLRRDLSTDRVPLEIIDNEVNRSYDRITSAPLIIVVCMTVIDMDVYLDEKRNQKESVMAVQSSAMAGQNILLTAHELGLGACWMCAPLFCPDVVQETLALPDDWQSQGIISLGYPAQERNKTREPLESRVIWR